MTCIESRIIILPTIPQDDVTILEQLILDEVLEISETPDGVMIFTDIGPSQTVTVPRAVLLDARNALAVSESSGRLVEHIDRAIHTTLAPEQPGVDELIHIDMEGMPWPVILQDILSRSSSLSEVRVLEWYNDVSQIPESFGARMMLITAGAIRETTSDEIFEELRRSAPEPFVPRP